MGKIIAVASGKGGTGKTTAAAALSSCLAVLEHKTLCIDFDVELRNLDLSLGMSDFTVIDFMDVVSGRMDILSACSESPKIPNLFFLSAPTEKLSKDINASSFRTMFEDIRNNFEYCIIDCPAGIGSVFQLAHSDADMSIIVTTGDLASMRDANRTASIVREMGITNVRLLVNRVVKKSLKHVKTNVDDVIDTVGVQLLGLIPEDKGIFFALHEGTPIVLYKKRLSAYDFLDAARRITGEEVPLQQSRRL